jgi:hypothetical protein
MAATSPGAAQRRAGGGGAFGVDGKSEVLQAYEYQRNRRVQEQPADGEEPLVERLDTITETTVARLLLDKLAKGGPPFGAAVLKPIREIASGGEAPEMATESEFLRLLARRGQPSKNMRQAMLPVLQRLKSDRLLREITPAEDKEFGRTIPEAHAAIFLVEKKMPAWKRAGLARRPKLRVITDARVANALLKEDCAFNLFTLDALLQCVSNVMHVAKARRKAYYVVNIDLRHWFHQLPLPRHLGRLFTLNMPTRKGQRYRLCPRAVPMGWKRAPKIGQAATWSMLLGRNEHNERLADASISGVHVKYTLSNEMPAWIPFEAADGQSNEGAENGGIFVILDNIFVVTPDERLATYWRDRILSQTATYNAEIKKASVNDQEVEPDVEVISADDKHRTEFMGISFGYNGWRTASKDQDIQLGDKWGGTHRDLAALLGEVLWSLRVGRRRLLECLDLMELYRSATPESHDQWDKPAHLFPEQFKTLKRYVAEARMHAEVPMLPHWQAKNVHLAATDASDSEQLKKIAYVPYDQSGQVLSGAWTGLDHTWDHINVAELAAIVHAVREALAADVSIDLFIIATDNTTAKGWVERGCADRADAQKLLRELFELLDSGEKPRRIYCPYVKSEHNVADRATKFSFSNGDKGAVLQDKAERTWSVLENAWSYCAAEAAREGRQMIKGVRPRS